jgi:hypothetical protein
MEGKGRERSLRVTPSRVEVRSLRSGESLPGLAVQES